MSKIKLDLIDKRNIAYKVVSYLKIWNKDLGDASDEALDTVDGILETLQILGIKYEIGWDEEDLDRAVYVDIDGFTANVKGRDRRNRK